MNLFKMRPTLLVCRLFIATSVASICGGASTKAQKQEKQDGQFAVWLESSLKRVYLVSEPGSSKSLELLAPRNGQVSFQASIRNLDSSWLGAECTVSGGEGIGVQVRRVDYVPVRHLTSGTDSSDLEGVGIIPGYVPDILRPTQASDVGSYQNATFWVTIRVPADARSGRHELKVNWKLTRNSKDLPLVQLPVSLEVSSFTVKERRDFPVTHWWRSECLWDYYKTGMYEDERHWEITRHYLQNLIDHGTDTAFVPILFMRRVTFERPAQMLIVNESKPGKYDFDFRHVRRFVQLAKECGAKYFEWPHLWIYWGVKHPMQVYTWKDGKAVQLWAPDSDGHGEVYYNFLRQFLPEFKRFLESEGILKTSFFHLSDEPQPGDVANYKKARKFLSETAPWMKVMDALSDIEYGRQKLTDMPIPMVSAAQAYIKDGIDHWVYYCCEPRANYLQRFLDTPLTKIRMSGWVFYKLRAKGFLHWGYNYWHYGEEEKLADVFGPPGLAPGDNFVVYPGEDGKPLDSIRWEVFAESLQDYAILQTAGISPDNAMLADIKDYAEFPRADEWIRRNLEKILRGSE